MDRSPPCLQFAVLTASNAEPEACVVCDCTLEEHDLSGVRLLTFSEIENERRFYRR